VRAQKSQRQLYHENWKREKEKQFEKKLQEAKKKSILSEHKYPPRPFSYEYDDLHTSKPRLFPANCRVCNLLV